jgi:hypothetical protein
MTDRDILRMHVEAVWDLTLPALDPSSQDFIVAQPLPPWSVYVATLADEEVVFWHSDVAPQERAIARTRPPGGGYLGGGAWDAPRNRLSGAPHGASAVGPGPAIRAPPHHGGPTASRRSSQIARIFS